LLGNHSFDYCGVWMKGCSGVHTNLNRQKVWELFTCTGPRPVAQVSVDDVWPALRFRPEEAVKSVNK
jgi:hypothetical protein